MFCYSGTIRERQTFSNFSEMIAPSPTVTIDVHYASCVIYTELVPRVLGVLAEIVVGSRKTLTLFDPCNSLSGEWVN